MQYYTLSHSKEGYSLRIGNQSLIKTLLARLVEKIDLLTGDRWCSGFHNDWFYRHSFGKRRFDETGWLINNINSKIIDSFNWFLDLEWHSEKELLMIAIDIDQARTIDPDFVARCESIFNDNAQEEYDNCQELQDILREAHNSETIKRPRR